MKKFSLVLGREVLEEMMRIANSLGNDVPEIKLTMELWIHLRELPFVKSEIWSISVKFTWYQNFIKEGDKLRQDENRLIVDIYRDDKLAKDVLKITLLWVEDVDFADRHSVIVPLAFEIDYSKGINQQLKDSFLFGDVVYSDFDSQSVSLKPEDQPNFKSHDQAMISFGEFCIIVSDVLYLSSESKTKYRGKAKEVYLLLTGANRSPLTKVA